jgi:hypothetical protein
MHLHPRRGLLRWLPILLLATLVACGGGSGSGDPSGGAFQPAVHAVLPQVVTLGGTVLAHPKVLPITYDGDPGAADVQAFLSELASTSTWGEATAEYGVGSLTILPPVTLPNPPATISDAELQTMLASNTTGTAPAWGAADPGTIYLFVLPQGTIEQDSSGACCSEYDGYHYETKAGSTSLAYAVSCACPGFDGPSYTPIQERTVDMSHELFESATDPFPVSNPAYTQEDDADIVWTLVTDGEVSDMCEFNDDANVVPPGSTYMIQRSWSNAAAARGDNPCVPVVTTTPYLNSFPSLSTIADPALASGFMTQAVNIPLGQKKTISLKLSSAAPTDNTWSVKVYDYDAITGAATPGLALSLDKATGRNGDVLQLTITAKKADTQIGGEAFIVVSDYGNKSDPDFESQLTMGLVTN